MKLCMDCVYCLVHETLVRWAEQRGEAEQERGDRAEEQKREVEKEMLVYSFSVAYMSNDRRIMNWKGCESEQSYRI